MIPESLIAEYASLKGIPFIFKRALSSGALSVSELKPCSFYTRARKIRDFLDGSRRHIS